MKDISAGYLTLMEAAVRAREFAYSPYSGYCVGAALLTHDGRIFTGCNVENAGFSATNCAERTAVFKAVSEGAREFAAIAVVGGRRGEVSPHCAPCGVCRQVLAEFCSPELVILLGTPEDMRVHTLGELLPFSFTGAEL
jgi:cytidine deaminase